MKNKKSNEMQIARDFNIQITNKRRIPLITVKKYGNKIEKKVIFKEEFVLVHNCNKEYKISKKEYAVIEQIKEANSYDEAFDNCKKLKIVKKEQDFNEIIENFREKKIILDVNLEKESDFTKRCIIKRNGIGSGVKEEKWQVKANHSCESLNGKVYLQDKEAYEVWICADGSSTVEELIARIGFRLKKENRNDVVKILEKYLLKFVALDIWDIEIIEKEYQKINILSEENLAIFDSKNLNEDSILVAVGYEVGKLDSSSSIKWVYRGKQFIELEESDYAFWRGLNKKITKLGQLQFKYGKSQEELLKTIIQPMLDKKVVMLWSTELLYNSSIVRVSSQGREIPSLDEHLSCKFKSIADIGYEPELFEFSHKLWSIVSGGKTVGELIEEMNEWDGNSENREGTKERVIENIIALISLGLVRVDVLN